MMASGKTAALVALARHNVAHRVHSYEIVAEAGSYGESVAATLGVAPQRLFKTLIAVVDDEPTMGIVPVAGRLSLKALARSAGGKRARMADPSDAERWTGYVTGGISPFGQKRNLPAYVDQSILGFETVFASAGQRGVQVELAPDDLISTLNASVADLLED